VKKEVVVEAQVEEVVVETVEAQVEEVVVETKAEEVEAQVEKPKTEVAVVEQTTQVAKVNPATTNSEIAGSVAKFTEQAAEQGFEDVEVGGFGSFPIIVLGTDGKFECDDEDWGNEGFIGQLQTTKAVYLCRQEGVSDGPTAYTYDQVNLNSAADGCTTVEELKAAWEEEGNTLEIKKYMEVLIEVVQEGHEYEGSFFIVKLPPSSVNAFNGQLFIANRKQNIPLNEVCIEFGVGKKRTSGTNKYYPWKFKIVK